MNHPTYRVQFLPDDLNEIFVQVVAEYKNFKGFSDWQSRTYKDISEFEASDCYGSAKEQAREDLLDSLRSVAEAYQELTSCLLID